MNDSPRVNRNRTEPGFEQPATPQPAESAAKKKRARRITDVIPAVRRSVTPLFRRGVTVERLASDLGIPPVQVLEHVVRDMSGAKHPGPVLVERKPVQSEPMTVAAFKAMRQTA